MTDILTKLRTASKAYYEGNPIMSDEEFDLLAEAANFDEVGAPVEERVKHPYRLFSLQKYYVGEGKDPLESYSKEIVETTKLDGAAIAVSYLNGKLHRVLTRGDGIEGLDITSKFLNSNVVPRNIGFNAEDILQITGEVVAPKEIPNARNYAAGALNLKDQVEFNSRDITFIAYGMQNEQSYKSDSYRQDMEYLRKFGFNTVLDSAWDIFPNDGRVFRVDSNKDFNELGHTAKHPRGAYALKTRTEGIPTKLLDVVWQTGKSGKVTPVAILDPIEIDGANISQATLNNIKYIEDLGLEIGCTVAVERAGGIIPRVLKRIL